MAFTDAQDLPREPQTKEYNKITAAEEKKHSQILQSSNSDWQIITPKR